MSTREKALCILDGLTDEQLEAFVTLFGGFQSEEPNEKGGKQMTCFFCKGDMMDSTTTFMVQLENCIVIVKNAPCHKCSQCEEESFSIEVTERLEQIVDKCKEALTEVAIVSYTAA